MVLISKPDWSGISQATKTWAWGQLKELVKDPYYAGQIQSRIDEWSDDNIL